MMLFVGKHKKLAKISHEAVTLLRMICLLCVCPVCTNYSAGQVVPACMQNVIMWSSSYVCLVEL